MPTTQTAGGLRVKSLLGAFKKPEQIQKVLLEFPHSLYKFFSECIERYMYISAPRPELGANGKGIVLHPVSLSNSYAPDMPIEKYNNPVAFDITLGLLESGITSRFSNSLKGQISANVSAKDIRTCLLCCRRIQAEVSIGISGSNNSQVHTLLISTKKVSSIVLNFAISTITEASILDKDDTTEETAASEGNGEEDDIAAPSPKSPHGSSTSPPPPIHSSPPSRDSADITTFSPDDDYFYQAEEDGDYFYPHAEPPGKSTSPSPPPSPYPAPAPAPSQPYPVPVETGDYPYPYPFPPTKPEHDASKYPYPFPRSHHSY
ncbi:hypothetical protein Pelo_17982 [Pelomyxa schiedti]|nr:hypothetical protein Pelo_17982 [Pelomyxa schiedti]